MVRRFTRKARINKGTVDTTGWAVGDIILFRFFRDTSGVYGGDNDTYTGDALVGIYHLEYLINKLGSAT